MIKDRRIQPSEIEQNYRALVESIKEYAIFMLDKTGKILSWDQGGERLFGYKREEIIGKNFSVIFAEKDVKRGIPISDMASAVENDHHLDERQYVRKDKTIFWSSGVLTSTKDKDGSHQGFSKIMRDITEQSELHRTAVHNSMHDFLTGLPNRNFFEENLIGSMPRTKKGNLLAILYMDFNNFKLTNDEYGHRVGDLILIEIAHRLTHNVRMIDMVSRFGGDEFVILAKQLRSKEDASRFAKKVLAAFHKPIVIERKKVQTSVSIGVALYPSDSEKPSNLLGFADAALYEAKKLGGNQFRFYSTDLATKK